MKSKSLIRIVLLSITILLLSAMVVSATENDVQENQLNSYCFDDMNLSEELIPINENSLEEKDIENSVENQEIKTFMDETSNALGNEKNSTNSLTMEQSSEKKGWQTIDGNKYYYISNDAYYKNILITIEGKTYYFDSNGHLLYGINKYNNKYYYSDSDGVVRMTGGWISDNGERKYYVGEEGCLIQNNQIDIGGKVNQRFFYFGSNCKLAKGVYQNAKNKNWYYADASTGGIRTDAGFVDWNNDRYYVKQGGALYRNQFIHSVDSDGNKKYYYVDSDCSVNIGTFTINGVTYTTDENGVINEEVVLQGTKSIDVSVFQGVIDWKKVKAAGITFAFIRVGGRYYGSGGMYDDSNFVTNIKGAIAAGIKVGVYYFTQAINNSEALEEAIYTINKIRGYNISMPVVIDTESTQNGRHNKISVATRTSAIKTFCDRIQAAGYTPMIYASTSWLNNQLNMSALSNYLVWVAQYYYKVTYNGAYSCWQYTSSGKVNGISGNVDMDYWYGSADSLITE